jgi:hypothetical protein
MLMVHVASLIIGNACWTPVWVPAACRLPLVVLNKHYGLITHPSAANSTAGGVPTAAQDGLRCYNGLLDALDKRAMCADQAWPSLSQQLAQHILVGCRGATKGVLANKCHVGSNKDHSRAWKDGLAYAHHDVL